MEQPELSLVIVNWNTCSMLRTCLASLVAAYERWPKFEVIIVDNGSSDDSVAMTRAEFPQFTLIENKKNLGFGGGNNAGLAVAKGKILGTINSDTEIVGDALPCICDYFAANKDVGVVGPKLLNTDGTVQLSCRRFPGFMTAFFNRYSLLTKLFPNNAWSREYLMTNCGHSMTMDVDWVSGAALFVRREVYDKVGGFDEDYFMYSEDVDWCYRIHRAGWHAAYLPDAVIIHHIGCSTGRAPFRMIWQRHRSMWIFYRKHYSFDIVLLDIATWLGIWTRFCVLTLHSACRGLLGKEIKS